VVRGAGHKVNAALLLALLLLYLFFWGAPHNKPFEAFENQQQQKRSHEAKQVVQTYVCSIYV